MVFRLKTRTSLASRCALLLCSWLPMAAVAAAADGADSSQHAPGYEAPMLASSKADGQAGGFDQDAEMRCGGDGHAHHKAMMARKGYRRSEQRLALSDVPLVDKQGKETTLLAELSDGRPVIVTFVFTTCTTICPVLSGTFSQMQAELGPQVEDVKMISISIDPEYDTPERLRAYAGLFDAGPQWQFLTGNPADIVAVQKGFGVYRGNKMNHEPTILLSRSKDAPWVRLDGLASAADVAQEYRQLVARN